MISSLRLALAGCLAWVISSDGQSAQVRSMPDVIVSATRFEDPVSELAINATVISADEIAKSTARTLPELLRSRAGVFTRDLYGNNAALATIDIRGFGANGSENTLILIDGRRLTDADRSGVQWSAVPLELIERVEILRGSGAVQFGDGASAGVINIITRHPAQGGSRATGSLRLGSFDTYDLTATLRASGEQTGLMAFAQNYDSDGYRENNRNRQSNLALAGSWTGDGMDATLRIAADRQGIRLPGARQVQPSAGVDELSFNRRGTATPLDYAQRNGNQAALDLQWQLGSGELILGFGYRDKRQRSYFDFSGFPDYRDIDLDVLSLQPRYRWRAQVLGLKHAFVVGADVARWGYRLLQSNAEGNIAQPHNRVDATQHNNAVYLLDSVKVSDTVMVNAGIRHERSRVAATDTFDPTAPGGAFGSGATTGTDRVRASAAEIGLRLQASKALALIARAGRSFRFANVDEIYETSAMFTRQFQFLRPQRAKTYEAGLVLGQGATELRAAVFRMDVRDEIHLDPFTTGVGNRNMPPLRRQGLELEWRRSVLRDLDVQAAYTYTQAKFQEGVLRGGAFTQQNVLIANRTVPLVPRHKLDLGVDWRLSSQTSLRTEWRYVSRQFMENDEGNTFDRDIPGYGIADIKLTHRMGKLKASAMVANVFDRKYYAYAVRSQFVADRFNAYPLPERSFWVTLEYSAF